MTETQTVETFDKNRRFTGPTGVWVSGLSRGKAITSIRKRRFGLEGCGMKELFAGLLVPAVIWLVVLCVLVLALGFWLGRVTL